MVRQGQPVTADAAVLERRHRCRQHRNVAPSACVGRDQHVEYQTVDHVLVVLAASSGSSVLGLTCEPMRKTPGTVHGCRTPAAPEEKPPVPTRAHPGSSAHASKPRKTLGKDQRRDRLDLFFPALFFAGVFLDVADCLTDAGRFVTLGCNFRVGDGFVVVLRADALRGELEPDRLEPVFLDAETFFVEEPVARDGDVRLGAVDLRLGRARFAVVVLVCAGFAWGARAFTAPAFFALGLGTSRTGAGRLAAVGSVRALCGRVRRRGATAAGSRLGGRAAGVGSLAASGCVGSAGAAAAGGRLTRAGRRGRGRCGTPSFGCSLGPVAATSETSGTTSIRTEGSGSTA